MIIPLICFFGFGLAVGLFIAKRSDLFGAKGELQIHRDEDDELYLFLEISDPVEELAKNKTISLTVHDYTHPRK